MLAMMAPHLLLWAIVFAVASLPELCYSFSLTAVRLPTDRVGRSYRWNSRQNHQHHRGQPSNLCMSSKLCMSTKLDTDNSSVQVAIDKFISTLQTSLDDNTFLSYTLKGPSTPRKRRKKSNNNKDSTFDLEQQKEKLRGKYKTISGRLVLLQDKKKKKSEKVSNNENDTNASKGTLYVQTTMKYHLATDVAKNWKVDEQSANNNSDKETEVEVGLRQLFSTAMGNEINAPLSEWGAQNVNGELGILSGELVTSDGIYKLQLQPSQKASFRLSKKKDSQQVNDMSALSHDRPKNVPLSPSSEFFQKLGVSNKDGKPLNGMASKLRQCQKFVEIVGTLIDNDISSNTSSPPSKIRTIDMGCGRGYLTFSLHLYLYKKFEADKNEPANISTQGIDRRPKLISEINGIAQSLGEEFKQLKFIEGTIGNTHNRLFGNDKDDNSLDILIALHACDTATDDALWYAISEDADIIVTAPCCQHELRPQIDKHTSNNPNHPLSEVLRHAIYRERATETVTDAMRAILLEIAGYQTSCFEFVGGEHTAKNVMITAQKMKRKRSDVEQEMWLQDRRRKLIELARLHGVELQRLAFLMGESILFDGETDSKSKIALKTGMPPL